MGKVLVIAAARSEFLRACLDDLDSDAEIRLWLNEGAWGDYEDLGVAKFCYGESFGVPSLSMVLDFFRFRPAKVVIVCGTTYYHENIYSAVSFFRKLTGNACSVCHYSLNQLHELDHAASGGAGEYGMRPFILFAAAMGALCCFLAWQFPLALIPLLMALVGYECLARPRGKRRDAQARRAVLREMAFNSVQEADGAVRYNGRLTRVGQNGVLEFTETAIKYEWFEHGCRVVSELPMDMAKPRILLLGCSVMYGLNVDDDKTCGWLLQQRFPEYAVVNGARSASSPYEMLHFLKESIDAIRPEVVVFGFWDGLEARNARLGKLSCCLKGKKFERGFGLIEKGAIIPQPNFPGVLQYNDSIVRKNEISFNSVMRETQEGVFAGFRQLCEKHDAAFVVACLNNSSGYHGLLHRRRFNWCVADTSWREEREKWLLMPHDSHPNSESNAVYADVIESAVRELREKGTCTPDLSNISIQDVGSSGSADNFIYPHY